MTESHPIGTGERLAEAVCAQCKGMCEDLAEGREPEELCDACYSFVLSTLRKDEAE